MIKIAFFDIDGTLLSHKLNCIPESAKYAVRALRAQGAKCFIATGRHITALERLEPLQGVEFDGMITMNGQYCVGGGEVLYENALHPDDVRRMKDFVSGKDISLGFMEARENYVNGYSDVLRRVHEYIHLAPPPIGDLEEGSRRRIYQMVLYGTPEEIDGLPDLPHTSLARWILGGVDMIPKDGSKAVGIAHVLAHYGIDKAEAIAFGDGENDIEMFGAVGMAVAMGNAPDHVKAHAGMITDSVEEDGVYRALAKLGAIEEMKP